MDFIELLKNAVSTFLGVVVALAVGFYFVWPKIEILLFKLNRSSVSENSKERMQYKFAAYERLLLFAHRITPQQLLLRSYDAQISIDEFCQLVLVDLDNEFQHNYTQQLYVSDQAWQIVSNLKSNTSTLIKNAKNGIGQGANVDDLVAEILKHVSELEINPYQAAQIILKKELSA